MREKEAVMTGSAQSSLCPARTLEGRGLMHDQNEPPSITAVDFNPDMVFVTFANGVSATYHAPFIFSVRENDSNQVVADEIPGEPERPKGIGEPLP